MVSMFVALVGLVVFGLGLLLLWLSVVSFAQGMRDFSIWLSFSLALFLIFAGNYTYKKFQKRRFINKGQVAQLFGVKKTSSTGGCSMASYRSREEGWDSNVGIITSSWFC